MNRSSVSARKAVRTAGDVAQRFAGDIENARQNRAGIDRRNGPGTRFSIQDVQGKDGDYPDCVVLDTDLFKGIKPRDWGRILQNHIYKNFAGQTLTLYDENWYSESLQIARYNDRVTKDGGVRNHRAIDDLAWTRGNNIQALATAHIGEILEVSTYEEGNDINRHGWMDKNGWTFRHAYLCDNKGNIYEATLNIAEGENRRILYRITNIKEIDKRTVGAKGLSAASGRNQATTNGSSKGKIPNNAPNVKHFSSKEQRNRINQDYLRAVANGDMRTAQRMVDEAAKRAGFTIKSYHGTGSEFNSFDLQRSGSNSRELVGDTAEGMFFFSSIREAYPGSAQDYARSAGKKTGQEVIRDVYLKMENPLELDSKGWYATADYYDNNRDSIYDQYLSGDYDGIIIRDSSGGDDNTIYLLDDANRIKSAEPVTYDDAGNVIPLSERFRTDRAGDEEWKNNDIRFSPSEADDDSLGVDWIGSREEGETKTQAVTETDAPHPSPAATPSPEGEGSETGGQAARVTENAKALAREKKVSIAEKASIEGLKARIESAEKRLGAYQILQQEGMMTDEIRAQMRDVQESLEIFRNALDEKKAKRKAAKEAEKNNKDLRTQRKQARAAEKKALAKEAELQADKPRQARKEFRQDALNLFSVPAAKRQTLGNLLNRFADTVTAKGSVSEADRRELFRQLYEAGVEVAQPEDYYRDIRDFVKSGRVYVPEDVRAEFGDDWDAFRKRAWGNGIMDDLLFSLSNMPVICGYRIRPRRMARPSKENNTLLRAFSCNRCAIRHEAIERNAKCTVPQQTGI